MSARLFPILALLLWPMSALGQGFAGMASDADGFALPAPGPSFEFPRDHGPHPDFRIEWWYVTANLTGEDGREYGIQWTLFRSALAPEDKPGWSSPQIWFGHAALTTAKQHFASETFARGGIGQAGVENVPFSAWINDWQMVETGASSDALDSLDLYARGDNFSYDLQLSAEGPIALQGKDGFSQKSELGQASYYYSQPHYVVQGTIATPARALKVTGQAWLDREWSSQPLAASQTGWDWFSLHLDGGEKLMVYRLRDASAEPYTPATWIEADGTVQSLPPDAVTLVPLTYTRLDAGRIPTEWRVLWPDGGIDITTRALNPESWMDLAVSYWEGPVHFDGTHTGRGYLEMTGYD